MGNGFLPKQVSEESVIKRIQGMFVGAEKLRYRNGSLAEAFPYESSFCVTALVAFDLLSAVELLDKRLSVGTINRYLAVVKPMISFLLKVDETHANISNHIATAAAAVSGVAREAGADERALRRCQNSRGENVPVLQAPVRGELHLRGTSRFIRA